ncbi:4-(cytidine 5'-diphospho)-2-C-methyl-D-erythritol kinase [Terrimonas ferruginea]|uniref:4-(cytidine 5'-diphospho)-2-C-methyl-D-erythritol kinase n=1 Tax=Terrimonas ferruginea TaxID=249 RepID=UPI00040A3B73|nr:4-(cytidine 5'-diphospho)-2-C-methyl-D-erythritol kinase [Terrimonas ferruginea]
MVNFPNCKINLGLRILRKRTDGYHDLETVFLPIAVRDILEAIPLPRGKDSAATIQLSGQPVPGDPQTNLVIKAWQLLKKDHPQLPAVQFHLHKTLPPGAGLGAGSADAAFALILLNQRFELGISSQQLAAYALQLGSDVPFFLVNSPAYATGRGEQLTAIDLDLSSYWIVLIHPRIHVSTAQAFSQLTPAVPAETLPTLLKQPIDTWKHSIVNDFEQPVFAQHPAIGRIKAKLYDAGAVYASMSGSGSSVFGIFSSPVTPIKFDADYFQITTSVNGES